MQFSTVQQMTESPGLRARLIGAAAMEGRADAPTWVDRNIYRLVSTSEWVDVWEYAEATKTVNVNQDTGARTDTILDDSILARVQYIIQQDSTPDDPNQTT